MKLYQHTKGLTVGSQLLLSVVYGWMRCVAAQHLSLRSLNITQTGAAVCAVHPAKSAINYFRGRATPPTEVLDVTL